MHCSFYFTSYFILYIPFFAEYMIIILINLENDCSDWTIVKVLKLSNPFVIFRKWYVSLQMHSTVQPKYQSKNLNFSKWKYRNLRTEKNKIPPKHASELICIQQVVKLFHDLAATNSVFRKYSSLWLHDSPREEKVAILLQFPY